MWHSWSAKERLGRDGAVKGEYITQVRHTKQEYAECNWAVALCELVDKPSRGQTWTQMHTAR